MKNLIKTLKEYDESRKSVTADYNKQITKIQKEYAVGGSTYNTKMEEAENFLNGSVKALTDKLLKQVDNVFSKTNKVLTDYVTRPMTTEEAGIMECIRTIRDSMTPAEAEAFLNSIRGSYVATKAFMPIYEAVKHTPMGFKDFDSMKKDLDDLESEVRKWINNFNPESYSHFVMTDDNENNPIRVFIKMIDSLSIDA